RAKNLRSIQHCRLEGAPSPIIRQKNRRVSGATGPVMAAKAHGPDRVNLTPEQWRCQCAPSSARFEWRVPRVPRGNPNPDTGGLFKSGPVAWDESQVTDFIHCCIKKMPYTAAPLPERPTLIRKRE